MHFVEKFEVVITTIYKITTKRLQKYNSVGGSCSNDRDHSETTQLGSKSLSEQSRVCISDTDEFCKMKWCWQKSTMHVTI